MKKSLFSQKNKYFCIVFEEISFILTNKNGILFYIFTIFLSSFIAGFTTMFYEAYHRIKNISNPEGPERIYTVVGNICETDTFAWDRKINEVREGDYLVFYNAGAYGFEMSSNFNSRLKPAEVLVKNGEAHLIRKRDVFEDLLKNQIEVL